MRARRDPHTLTEGEAALLTTGQTDTDALLERALRRLVEQNPDLGRRDDD